MNTAAFWKAAFERAIKTFAQALVALLIADQTDVLNTDWGSALSAAGMAAIISLLTSLGSDWVTKAPGPSLTDAETLSGKSFESSHKLPEQPGGGV